MSAFIIDDNGRYIPVFGEIATTTTELEGTTTINGASTDGQVPTAKTVFEYVPILTQYGTIVIDI